MARRVVVGTLLVALAVAGCGGETQVAPPDPGTDTPPTRTAEEMVPLLVGTWDYGLAFASGDVVPCVREIDADGTGRQYAKETGIAGAQPFRWTLGSDGRTLTLTYGETPIVYEIESMEPGKLSMKAGTRDALTEVCVKR